MSVTKVCKITGIVLQSIQLLSHVRFFVTLWTTAHQASLSITDWELV